MKSDRDEVNLYQQLPSLPVWKIAMLATEMGLFVSICRRQSIKHLRLSVVTATLSVSLLEGPIKIEKGWSLCFSVTNSYILFTLISLGIKTIELVRGKRKRDQGLPSVRIIRAACQQSTYKVIFSQECLSTIGAIGHWTLCRGGLARAPRSSSIYLPLQTSAS